MRGKVVEDGGKQVVRSGTSFGKVGTKLEMWWTALGRNKVGRVGTKNVLGCYRTRLVEPTKKCARAVGGIPASVAFNS